MPFVSYPNISSANEGTVPPIGDPNSLITAIGEAPARNEIVKGKPFTGPAGFVFDQCIHLADLSRAELYITNVSKKPVETNIEELIGRNGLTKKGEYWKDKLKEELESTKSNVFVAMGRLACYVMTGRMEITKLRGSILESTLLPGRKVIPTIHPASALHGNFFARYYIVEDFKRAVEQSTFPEIKLLKRNYIIRPSWQDATDYIDDLRKKQGTVSWDIEVTRGEVSCFGVAPNPTEAMCIPVDRYSQSQEASVWKSISDLMEDSNVPKLGMNLIFDTSYILAHNRIQTRGHIDDIMIAHHILYPDFPKGLDFLVSFQCKGEPYYKDEGKQWKLNQIKDWDQWWTYNCKDCTHAFEVWDNGIKNKITEEGFYHYYRATMDYFDPVNFMVWQGIKVDPEAIKIEKERTTKGIEDRQIELNKITEREFNVNSPKQCKEYFYVELGITPFTKYNKTKRTSSATMDDKALERLAKGTTSRKPIPAAKLVQEIRGMKKLSSTYLDIGFDKDGRFRCSYNLRGTPNNRFASSKTIDGTGMNHQNLPLSYRGYLIPDDNHILIEWDKAQAEWVVVAYISGDANMIQVVEKKLDAHAVSGSMITGLPIDYIKLEDKHVGHSRDPMDIEKARVGLDLWCMENKPEWTREALRTAYPMAFWPRGYSIRQCGKHSNHGFNYDMQAARFALEYETELELSKTIYEGYHRGYSGLKHWYKRTQDQLDRNRTLENCYGDKRRFLGEWGDDLFKAAYDWNPQSTVSRNNKVGMVRIYKDRTPWMRPVRLMLEGHDSNLAQAPFLNLRDLAKVIQTGIEHMNDKLSWEGRDFSIRTDCKIGFNWRDMIELKSLDEKTVGDLELELPGIIEQAREKHEQSRRGEIR